MKITYLLTTADNMGGTERAVFAQASALGDEHEVRILSVFKGKDRTFFSTGGATIEYVVESAGGSLRPIRRDHGHSDAELRSLTNAPSALIHKSWEAAFCGLTDVELEHVLGNLDTDILVASTPPLMALAAELAPQAVIVVDEEHRPSAFRGADQEPLLIYGSQVDAIVSLTSRSTEWFAETLGPDAPNLDTIPNSIPHMFRPRSTLTNKMVIAAGRFSLQKQFDHLIRAFRIVVDEYPDWTLRIYGDGSLAPSHRRLISVLGLSANVELPGPVAAMTDEWSKGSIFAATSRSEGLPLVALEACAAGLPIVSYDCPTGPAEIIDDNRNGILVPPADIEAMAASLLALIRDDELRHTLGANSFRSASRYDPDTVRTQWVDLFKQLLIERERDGSDSTRISRAARRAANFRIAGGGDTASLAARVARRIVPPATAPAVVEKSPTPRAAQTLNALSVLAVLAKHRIPHFLVPGYQATVTVVGVPAASRAATFQALRSSADLRGALACSLTSRNRVMQTKHVADITALGVGADIAVRIYRPITDPTGALNLGQENGCDLEFWEPDPADASLLLAPRHNRLVDEMPLDSLQTLPVELVGDVRVPSLSGLAGLMWDTVDFPIDVVYTWVDGSDEAWQRRKAAAHGDDPARVHEEAAAAQRFTNRDELMFSLRSLDQFAPWVRHIYLVTDQQTPSWLRTDAPGLRVVDHREIFTDLSHLPTFNSHAIETQLHHIGGLGEHFIYLNDDVMFGRSVGPEMFFHSNGISKFFPSPVKLNYGGNEPPHIQAGRLNRDLLRDEFGRSIAQCMLHTPIVLRRSILDELEERYPERFAETAARRFRGAGDTSVPSSLYPYYAFMTGRAVPGNLGYSYMNLGTRSVAKLMSQTLRERNRDVICLGDSMDAEWSVEEQAQVARSFLTEYYPVPSPFEK